MVSAKSVVLYVGIALIVAGGILGVYGLINTNYSPLTAPWGNNVIIWWGGIAGLIVGVVAVAVSAFGMREKREEERKPEQPIPA